MATNEQNQPSPQLFFSTLNSYQKTAALKSAIELDLFTAIADHHSAADIGRATNASERGIRILCDFLTIMGFLQKQENRYALTRDSGIFLNRKSPAYLGDAVEFLLNSDMKRGFENLTESIRKGGTTLEDQGAIAPENPVWIKFARAMRRLQAFPAQTLAGIVGQRNGTSAVRVLDIAAGHGEFGIAIARSNPSARVTALDWKNVLQVARQHAQESGVADRMEYLEGSAFEMDFGKQKYDAVLLTNFLHHFDQHTCEGLLKKVFESLKPGGWIYTVEFVPNEDRISPSPAAEFAIMMLAGTPAGDAYTFAELKSMHEEGGFQKLELLPLPPAFQMLVVGQKPEK
jgi:2-polyprenyl-3-methyl-5-hydroxy-6-metoxy-1,4-benzoquinol methylase